jgi:hypothetical protein
MHIKEIFLGTYPRCSRLFTVLYKDMYTNLVVIVNERKIVDKCLKLFVNSCLRVEKSAGQGLYHQGTVVGQKSGCGQRSWFCTSHPVDIQRVIHTAVARIFCFWVYRLFAGLQRNVFQMHFFDRVSAFLVFQRV